MNRPIKSRSDEIASLGGDTARWDILIGPPGRWISLDLASVWRYRDLIWLFFKRDFVAFYKQSILGPLWYLIQPTVTSVLYFFIFARIANISTAGLPGFIFYMSGIILWTYFSNNLTNNAEVFSKNAAVFGKVYFPRLVIPISVVLSGTVAFAIQFGLLMVVTLGLLMAGSNLAFSPVGILAVPVLILYVACLGIGIGLIVSALTVRYRDLAHAVGFMTQLWMFASPVVYPLSQVPARYQAIYHLNPMTAPIESFRAWLFGTPSVELSMWASNLAITCVLLFAGLTLFSRAQLTAMDTV
jgi:homopolymeric O-antigen transport system permease protein